MIKIVAVAGSLRRNSYNRAFLAAVPALLPFKCDYTVFDGMSAVPLYNEDIDTEPGPAAVKALRDAVAAADGVIISSPEYNQSIPGVLKNALDWLSRPHGRGALRGKAVLAVVVTLSRGNGARALSDINRVVSYLGNCALYQPEMVLPSAPSLLRVNDDGTVELTDTETSELVTFALEQLEFVVRAGTALDSAELLDARRAVVERARFTPLIREAISRGASQDAIENRLRGAGMDSATARDLIWCELAASTRGGVGRTNRTENGSDQRQSHQPSAAH